MSPGLPNGWREVALGEVAETSLGKMLDRSKVRGGKQVPYLRNQNVQWGRFDLKDVGDFELTHDELDRFEVLEGDLLVCEGGEIGRCAVWPGSTNYLAYQKALHRVRPSKDLDPRYLRYLLESLSQRGVLANHSTGTTIQHLPQVALRAIRFPMPDRDEQERIVAVLEDHFSRLDTAREYLSRCATRRSHLLVAHLSFLAKEAQTVALRQVAVSMRYGTSIKCGVLGAGRPVARIPNVRSGRLDMRDEKRALDVSVNLGSFLLKQGDVLVIRSNGSLDLVGRSAVVEGDPDGVAFASYLIRLRPDPATIDPHWLSAMLGLPAVRSQIEAGAASSAGQHNVNLATLAGLAVPLPALQQQRVLLQGVEQLMEEAARLDRQLQAAHDRERALRRTLLTAGFSGIV